MIGEGAGCKEYLVTSVLDGLEEVPSLEVERMDENDENMMLVPRGDQHGLAKLPNSIGVLAKLNNSVDLAFNSVRCLCGLGLDNLVAQVGTCGHETAYLGHVFVLHWLSYPWSS